MSDSESSSEPGPKPRVNHVDRKGSTSKRRKKQPFRGNIHTRDGFGYAIIDKSVFGELAKHLACKTCKQPIKFELASHQGLAFNLKIICRACQELSLKSSPVIQNTLQKDVNVRAALAMRMIGQGLSGLKTFCAFMCMDTPVSQKVYESYNNQIMQASENVAQRSMALAVEEEIEKTGGRNLIVSGDGSWRRAGFSSLQGVATLIGARSKLVIDTVTKNSTCKMCDHKARLLDPEELEIWKAEHAPNCTANHSENAGKMETDAISEMFRRSEPLYDVRYWAYIGDGDSKTLKRLHEDKPYGENLVQKKECISHIQKRMGTRLRNLRQEKGSLVSGPGKLTLNYVGILTAYYGKAIRQNCESVDNMRRAIQAVYFHESSTDKNPQHHLCPTGPQSWCKFNKSVALNTSYTHKKTMPAEVWALIKPIFISLSEDSLLERCLGGFTQNSNECLNSKIWKLAPKKTFSGFQTVRAAVALATISFNEGMEGLIEVVDEMRLKTGPSLGNTLANFDLLRIEHHKSIGRPIKQPLEANSDVEDEIQYGAGIAD